MKVCKNITVCIETCLMGMVYTYINLLYDLFEKTVKLTFERLYTFNARCYDFPEVSLSTVICSNPNNTVFSHSL